jgi:hypothetical protein
MDGGYEIQKSLPKKNIPEGDWVFSISDTQNGDKNYIPIEEGNPFPVLHKLAEGRFSMQEGKPFIMLLDQSSTLT